MAFLLNGIVVDRRNKSKVTSEDDIKLNRFIFDQRVCTRLNHNDVHNSFINKDKYHVFKPIQGVKKLDSGEYCIQLIPINRGLFKFVATIIDFNNQEIDVDIEWQYTTDKFSIIDYDMTKIIPCILEQYAPLFYQKKHCLYTGVRMNYLNEQNDSVSYLWYKHNIQYEKPAKQPIGYTGCAIIYDTCESDSE